MRRMLHTLGPPGTRPAAGRGRRGKLASRERRLPAQADTSPRGQCMQRRAGAARDPPDSQEGESRSQRTTFGGATPLAKPVKTRGAARAGGGGPARRGGSGGAGGGGPAQTAMCLLQAAGTGLRGRRRPTRPARTHAAGAGLRGPGRRMSIPSGGLRPSFPPAVCLRPFSPPAPRPTRTSFLAPQGHARLLVIYSPEAQLSAPPHPLQLCTRARQRAGGPARAGGRGRDPLAAAAAAERVEESRRGRRCA